MAFRGMLSPAARRQLHGMTIGVAKEDLEGEARVGLHPENVGKLIKKGAKVVVQKSAGEGSGYSDDMYTAAGATIADEGAIWKSEVRNLVLELDFCIFRTRKVNISKNPQYFQ
jgi:alanine dehydrogenase